MKSILLLVLVASTSITQAGDIKRVREPVNGEYLVTLRTSSGSPLDIAAEITQAHGGRAKKIWTRPPVGFLFEGSETAATAIARNPNVRRVEENAVIHASAVQPSAPWHLDRIDQSDLPLSGDYVYCNSGSGVTVYVMDTGTLAAHQEFWTSSVDHTSRVSQGTDLICTEPDCNDASDPPCSATNNASHGTAVASVIGGLTVGVAKAVRIVPVRFLNCAADGTAADARTALDWIDAQEQASQPETPSVVNMSWWYLPWEAGATMLEEKIEQLMASNTDLVFVTSANNFPADASDYIPARIPGLLTVGGTNANDGFMTGTCYGSVLDVLAPGDDIDSAHLGDGDDYRQTGKSGTSFASAVVAGVAARLAGGSPDYTSDQVMYWVRTLAIGGRISGVPSATTDKLVQGISRCRLVP